MCTRSVEPIEYIGRPARQGLGAATSKFVSTRKLKPGEKVRKVLSLVL